MDGLALKPREQGLSSNAVPSWEQFLTLSRAAAILAVMSALAAPLAAQDDTAATRGEPSASAPPPAASPQPRDRINLMVTRPRGDINEAQVQECEERADAGAISGEIVVCRQVGEDPDNVFSSTEEARKRYAEATANKNAPPPPDVFGIPDNGKGISIGGVPPPALMIDVSALPKAPAGSDADRIARGLPPLGQDEELTEEQEKARREALGIKVAPPPRTAAKKKR